MQLCPLLLLLLLGGFGVAKEEREPLPSASALPSSLSSISVLCCSPLSLLSAALLSPYSLLLSSLPTLCCSPLSLSCVGCLWVSCLLRSAGMLYEPCCSVTETTAHGTGYGLWIMEVPWYYSIWYI